MTIIFHDVTYSYRRWQQPVLTSLDYRVPKGFTVLLGANGAGKSTLLKLAAGAAAPRTGTVTLDRLTPTSRDYRQRVAWMPQKITPVPSLTAREYVAYAGWLKGLDRTRAWQQAQTALQRVELTEQSGQRTHRLSGGQLRRVGVAAALVHEADVLLLDEPTAGMDPRQRRIFRDLLCAITGQVSVLMSTHDVADLAEEADHVTLLDNGRITYNGTTTEFLAHAGDDVAAGRRAESAYTALSGLWAD